ncbi:M20 family metallopeptidase [Microbacterium sp. 4R-513]|uniref:M20 family metallopeptidase n=1 Tax=Microbacterium sp. 4R-513 TaxID=2567934 RepID=UPI0013E17E83|nr:M20 family metallopeptidase [Microbacterium sp. 4R-513]QIG39356.1 M20 family metallopeptidase [Microbacterium sp. 4R-513]
MTAASRAAAAPSAVALRDLAQSALPVFRRELAELVSIDSGSDSPEGVDAAGDWCAARLASLGFDVERIATPPVDGRRFGGVVIGRLRGSGARRILLFAHLDTVFAEGTAAARPYREEGGRAYGPGVCDDKGGALAGIHAAELLIGTGFTDFAELVIALTPDEEVGSPASGSVLTALAAEADAALCLECARENGDLVVARKGVADVRIDIRGRAAHSGVEPHRGRNAAVEAAHLLLDVQALNGIRPDVAVNIGVVSAGERTNVIPAAALLSGEVRSTTLADLEWALDSIEERAAATVVDGVTVGVERLAVCPPLETASTHALFRKAIAAADELGIELSGAATGGVSDANFVAATGTPVLDGLGPIGGDDHADSEWLDLESVPERLALLAALVVRIASE